MDIVYDLEVFPNCFTLAAEDADSPITWAFEISDWHNDSKEIIEWLHWISKRNGRMVGFNNVGFDYPVVHLLIQTMGKATALDLYRKCVQIIEASDTNRFAHMVYPSDRCVDQLDLYKIHHFDNKARSTSLKALEFNMRLDNVSDLPFPPGSTLNVDQIKVLKEYNAHDVSATKVFYHKSLEMIKFRESLTAKHGRDFMNHSDVKIGKEIFQMELEKSGVQCYKYGPSGREPMQTKRDSINIGHCIPFCVKLEHPEFVRVRDWMASQVITETKGAFKDVKAKVGGLEFIFGTGGIHASVENKVYEADADYMILDIDVQSLYPSIAIAQKYYPEHLGMKFVQVYERLKAQRISYAKNTAENAMLKLALNGVYGASGDKFSIFYDPLFTMKITIGGQLMIAMLAEHLLSVDHVEIIQCNTDGITLRVPRTQRYLIDKECSAWEQVTGLHLEHVEYSKMAIADVNNYIAVGTDGKVKRKGKYEYDTEWHQNASALVVSKIVEKVLLEGVDVMTTLTTWSDKMDFMSRVKVPRSSRLIGEYGEGEIALQNTTRYYVAKNGLKLVKIMPPLAKKPGVYRRIGVESGWTVCVCNDIKDAVMPIDYTYYQNEIEKLLLGLK